MTPQSGPVLSNGPEQSEKISKPPLAASLVLRGERRDEPAAIFGSRSIGSDALEGDTRRDFRRKTARKSERTRFDQICDVRVTD